MSGLAASRAGHKKGREELGKGPEDIQGEGLCGVALGEGEDSFEATPKSLLAAPRGTRRGMRKFRRSHRRLVSWRSSRNANVPLLVRRSTKVAGDDVRNPVTDDRD